jgi:hypothetical protein
VFESFVIGVEFIFGFDYGLIVAIGRWLVDILFVVETSVLVIAILVKVKAVRVLEAAIFVNHKAFSIVIAFNILFNRILLVILVSFVGIVSVSFVIVCFSLDVYRLFV